MPIESPANKHSKLMPPAEAAAVETLRPIAEELYILRNSVDHERIFLK